MEAAGSGDRHARPLAVMPPAPGKRVSHLVVGAWDSSELLVLSLPDLVLVHTHVMDGMKFWALAADPWGEALIIGDGVYKVIHDLPWPLMGMPALQ